MLGWRVLDHGEYFLDIPILSEQEKKLILASYTHAKDMAEMDEDSLKIVREAIKRSAEDNGFYLTDQQFEYLARIAFMYICGFGFLGQLIADDDVEEISIIGPNKPAYAYIRKKGWVSVNGCFETAQDINDVINRMAKGLGRHITIQNPRLDAVLPDGSRLHASLPPISDGEITIRKFRRCPFSPKELSGIMPLEIVAFLSMVIQCDFSLLIAGNTASGKTTTLNALFSFVPFNERVLITEETPEINVPHSHQLRLIANKEMGIGLKNLVYDSLRMRPDRMIVGEVRDREEAEALFDVLLAGQARGSYATFHAQSAKETLARLAAFGIEREDLGCIDCIIIQRRILEYDNEKKENQERRLVTEIAEVVDGEARVFYRDGKLNLEGTCIVEKICKNLGIERKDFEGYVKKRKEIIESAESEYKKFFVVVQKELFGLGR